MFTTKQRLLVFSGGKTDQKSDNLECKAKIALFGQTEPSLCEICQPTSWKKCQTATIGILEIDPEFVDGDQGARPARPVPAQDHQGTWR